MNAIRTIMSKLMRNALLTFRGDKVLDFLPRSSYSSFAGLAAGGSVTLAK